MKKRVSKSVNKKRTKRTSKKPKPFAEWKRLILALNPCLRAELWLRKRRDGYLATWKACRRSDWLGWFLLNTTYAGTGTLCREGYQNCFCKLERVTASEIRRKYNCPTLKQLRAICPTSVRGRQG